MNVADTPMPPSQSNVKTGSVKTHAVASYALMIVGLFTAVPIFIGAIWAMVKRSKSVGSVYHSHYTNAIRTFWWSVVWTIVGAILSTLVIGYAILAIAWFWALYRLINGFAKIIDDEAYPL